MKIKIHQSDLNKALNIVEKALSSKNVIESLKGIKIKVDNDQIVFLASKSEIAIEYKLNINDVDLEIFETGSFIVPGFYFINIIRKINSNYITIETINKSIKIQSNKSNIELICFDNDSYPLINFELTGSIKLNMNKNLIEQTFNKTKYAISNNPINPILTGINYNFKDDYLKIYTTDSLRMIYYKMDYKEENEVSFTIHKSLMQDIIKVLSYEDDEIIKLEVNQSQCLINSANLNIKIRLLEGNFPNIEKIIPSSSTFNYIVEKEDLYESLQRVILLTERNESVVVASISDNVLTLKSSHKFLGTIEEYTKIFDLKGNPFEIAFDPYFVLDSLNTIDRKDVKLEFTDEISGFVIKDPENDNVINIISPIRLN